MAPATSPIATAKRNRKINELTENKIVRSEDLTERSRADRVHGAWLKVDQDCARYVLSSSGLVVVNVDALQLEVGVAMVGTSWVNAMFVRDDLPELKGTGRNKCNTTDMLQVAAVANFRVFFFRRTLAPIWLPHWPA